MMDDCMDGCWMDGWMMDECMNEWMYECMLDEWMNVQMDDGWIDGFMNVCWMDGWTVVFSEVKFLSLCQTVTCNVFYGTEWYVSNDGLLGFSLA